MFNTYKHTHTQSFKYGGHLDAFFNGFGSILDEQKNTNGGKKHIEFSGSYELKIESLHTSQSIE